MCVLVGERLRRTTKRSIDEAGREEEEKGKGGEDLKLKLEETQEEIPTSSEEGDTQRQEEEKG